MRPFAVTHFYLAMFVLPLVLIAGVVGLARLQGRSVRRTRGGSGTGDR